MRRSGGLGPSSIFGSLVLLVFVACGRVPLDLPALGPEAGASGGSAGRVAAGASGTAGTVGPTGAAGTSAAGTSGAAGGTTSGLKKIGEPCAERIDCESKFCANGVCCSSPCESSCLSCALPGSVGVCAPLPIEFVCSAPRCEGSQLHPEGTCDGRGNCRSPVLECAPFGCNAATAACVSRCASDADCAAGTSCINGNCGRPLAGVSCMTGAECASGFCAQNVCCTSPCSGGCVSCALPGRAGVCSPVPAGTVDPNGVCRDQGPASCGMTGTCDGRGACARYPRGTTCAAQTCLGDTITAPATCDGIGTCVGGFKISCVPFTCDQARGQCFSACMSDAQCAANTSCTGNLCGIRQNTPCTIDAECATGFCAQGVCCNAPCRSPCVSCGLAGHVGQCTPVPVVGALDPSGTCVDQGPSSCGTNGRCDGNGGCALYPPGTICSAPTCVGDKLTFSGFCDVQMTCVAPSATSCAPFTCRTDVPMCHAGCPNGDAICPPDAYCTGDEQCVPKKPPGGPCQSDHECQSSVCTPTPDGGVATCAGFI